MKIVLQVQNLTKLFENRSFWGKAESFTAVDNISFGLHEGKILGLLGPNGAGKTTTIQMLLGTLTPSSGTIKYFNQDFNNHRIAALRKIGYASGYDRLPGKLTVLDNLDIVGRIYGITEPQRSQKITDLLKFFGIWNMANKQVGHLSAGQATRVMLAKAFINDPKIALLDEPTASLDPDVAQEVRKFILTQCKELGTSILITSHNMNEVTELCDQVLVLKKGIIIANDTPESLAQSISKVRVQLMISSNLKYSINHLQNMELLFTKENEQVTIEIEEHAIAHLLVNLANHHITYSHISINKPTLEDYFLSIAKLGKNL